jgi:Ran GTPase-activating protein (RanGAP) involved in mRNA processing and transport
VYLRDVKKLNLAGCALTDNSVTELISSLKALHNQTITSLDLSDNKLTDQAILSLIDFLARNSSLKEVILQDVPDITQPMMTRLNAALKKNQMGLPSVDLMFQTAKQVDQAMNRHLKFV